MKEDAAADKTIFDNNEYPASSRPEVLIIALTWQILCSVIKKRKGYTNNA
jgi:hypothetical protein